MVIKNTLENKRIAKKMAEHVHDYGFHANVDYTWNCGADIRFEIGTSELMDDPFIVSTWCLEGGSFGYKVRFIKTAFEGSEIESLYYRMQELSELLERLSAFAHFAKPELSDSYYADEA